MGGASIRRHTNKREPPPRSRRWRRPSPKAPRCQAPSPAPAEFLVGDPVHDPVGNRGSLDGFREAPLLDRLGSRPAQQLRHRLDRAHEQNEINRYPDPGHGKAIGREIPSRKRRLLSRASSNWPALMGLVLWDASTELAGTFQQSLARQRCKFMFAAIRR